MCENKCKRCGTKDCILIMSMFNNDMICTDCKEKEKKHHDYEKAEQADIEAIKIGNYNFKGIGKPSDL